MSEMEALWRLGVEEIWVLGFGAQGLTWGLWVEVGGSPEVKYGYLKDHGT